MGPVYRGVVRRHVLMTPLKLLDSEDAAKNPFLNWPAWPVVSCTTSLKMILSYLQTMS